VNSLISIDLSLGILGLSGCTTIQAIALPSQLISQLNGESMTDLPRQLINTEWVLESAGMGVVDRGQTTLHFGETGRISGKGGCNRYGGTARLGPASAAVANEVRFTVSGVVSTKMMCINPAVMDQETRYFQMLQSAERLRLEGDYLLIYSKGTAAPLRFTRVTSDPSNNP
jgi:heat shock protein HslJ